MTAAKEEFDAWKPDVERRVSDLQHALPNLGRRIEKLTVDSSTQHPRVDSFNLMDDPVKASVTADLVAPSKETMS